MATKTVFDQEGRQAAAAAPFLEGLLLEPTHHATRQGDVEPFGFSCLGDLCGGRCGLIRFQPVLQLLQQGTQY